MSGELPESGGGQPPTARPVAVPAGTSIHSFISYASQDVSVADAIVDTLERHGLKCWIAPRDVKAGALYADAIVRAISGAKTVVLVLSENAIASAHVGKEVERACSKKRPIIALRIDAAPLTPALEYFLSESQWVEAQVGNMRAAYSRLIDSIRDSGPTAPEIIPAWTSRTTAGTAPAVHPKSQHNRMLLAAGLAIVAVLLADRFWLSKQSAKEQPVAAATPAGAPTAAAISDKSIAVLPFLDMSEKKDQEYFADGMAEEVLDLLAKIPGLHVAARTSSFYFKGKSEDIPTIARRLFVADVLEGSVRKSGDNVRITVQLVRADNGYHVWSETFDRKLDDIFKVQDEIAAEVVRALKISLGANEIPRAAPTKTAEAHTLLLQARYFLHRKTDDDYKRAASYYEQAISLDPDSAVAWAGLSKALISSSLPSGGLRNGQTMQHVRAPALRAAERAVALDPQLADAHESLADVHYLIDWDWAATDAEVARARALDPNSTRALTQAGKLAQLRGHLTDALQLWWQAAASDPLNPDAYNFLGALYYALGQFNDAEAAARRGLELTPNAPYSHAALAAILFAKGQQGAALAEIEKESDPGFRAYALTRVYILLGRKGDADAALAQAKKAFAASQPYNIATLYALRRELDQAFLWLNRAYQQHDPDFIGWPPFTVDPDLKSLRGDPRYKAYLRKMNLPE
jgi:TolB-like protein/Tfp pilus assembly protein PilF